MHLKHYLLLAPEPGDSGSDPVARGDFLEAPDIDPDDPDGQLAEKEAVKADPKVKELEAEIEGEGKPDDDKKKDSRIPLSRHEAVLSKEREKRAELERQLARYQQGGQLADMNAELTAAENNILKMEQEYTDLIQDGEGAKAIALMQQIRKTERDMAEAKSDMKIHAAEVRATERARYNTVLSRIEGAYPVLNPDGEDYNEVTMNRVAKMSRMNQGDGMTPSAALQDAVETILGAETSKQENATTVTPRVTEKDVAAERKAGAADKMAKALAKTPPSLARSGIDSDKLGGGKLNAAAVMNMSQKEFATISEADLSKMRGDNLS